MRGSTVYLAAAPSRRRRGRDGLLERELRELRLEVVEREALVSSSCAAWHAALAAATFSASSVSSVEVISMFMSLPSARELRVGAPRL